MGEKANITSGELAASASAAAATAGGLASQLDGIAGSVRDSVIDHTVGGAFDRRRQADDDQPSEEPDKGV